MKTKSILISFLLWSLGFLSLVGFWSKQISYSLGGPPKILYPVGEFLYKFFIKKHFQPWETISNILYWYVNLSFVFVCFLSFLGIFFGIKSLNYKQKIAIFLIVLNSVNLIFSFIIAWLLFGLTSGM